MGEFGVSLRGSAATICKLPETLALGDVTGQGLPFYSGSISYHTGIRDRRVSVALGDCYGAVSKAEGDSHTEYIAFAPYESAVFDCMGELKIVVSLTRRNTFGPLHLTSVLSPSYGPETFLTSGADYTDSYCLIPQGILGDAIVKLY